MAQMNRGRNEAAFKCPVWFYTLVGTIWVATKIALSDTSVNLTYYQPDFQYGTSECLFKLVLFFLVTIIRRILTLSTIWRKCHKSWGYFVSEVISANLLPRVYVVRPSEKVITKDFAMPNDPTSLQWLNNHLPSEGKSVAREYSKPFITVT